MRIVFMGTPDFAVVSLKKLLAMNYEIAAIVSAPDKPKGRGLRVHPSPVKRLALAEKIEVLQPDSLDNFEFIEQLKKLEANLFVIVAFRILPKVVFSIPPLGTVNLHASLLPKYRGAAPINWAIINGETVSGVTTILINERVDTGSILLQRQIPIGPQMTAGDLHDVLAHLGSEVLAETLERISRREIQSKMQNDLEATNAPKIKKETCHLNFGKSAVQIYNLIRGLNPYPAAFVIHREKQLKIYQSQIAGIDSATAQSGEIIKIDKDSFTVKCGQGSIEILEVQLEGKKRLTVKEFFNGYTLDLGEILH